MENGGVKTLKATAKEWAKKVGVDSVEKLNCMIKSGNALELVLVCEAMQSNCLYDIAKDIVANNKKIILISGPSSAGKTTLSKKLGIQLRSMGVTPHAIAADNYFVNRDVNPRDENGNYDFECLEAMDIEKLNEDMTALLRGEIIDVPEFNFLIGVREYHGHYLKIEEKDVVIMEGIHSLNPKMTYALNDEDKYRIYVSPLNQLYVTCGTEDSEPHKVSTIDSRLLRRMVRDNRCRGNSPEKTLEMWASVRKGEEKYIFPYEDQADVMFNSGLLYEYSAIKAEAVRLLEMVGESSPYYQDVCRLKKFMDVFCEMDTECIPPSSILREFIGGSCFE